MWQTILSGITQMTYQLHVSQMTYTFCLAIFTEFTRFTKQSQLNSYC